VNAKARRLKEQLERAGGVVFLPDDVHDDVAEMFVNVIMSCSDCAKAISASSKQLTDKHDH
jgi:hypothetical protein